MWHLRVRGLPESRADLTVTHRTPTDCGSHWHVCRRLAVAQDAVQAALATALETAAATHRQHLSEELQQLEEAAAASRASRLADLLDANETAAADSLKEAAHQLATATERAVTKERVSPSLILPSATVTRLL